MQPGDLSDIPNPFALQLRASARPLRKAAAVAALKFLILITVCFSLVLVVSFGGKTWLLHRLTHDFESLASIDQQARLVQIAEFGPPSIDLLVAALAHADGDVARTALDLLRQSQSDWTVLSQSQQQQRHAAMIAALRGVAEHLPVDRTGWATGLLQQIILATVRRTDDGSRNLYRDANETLDLLSLSRRPDATHSTAPSATSTSPQRLSVDAKPLPVAQLGSGDQWVDWPPPPSREDSLPADDSASIYRSSSTPLQPVEPEQVVVLRQVAQPMEEQLAPLDSRETSFQTDEVQSAAHLMDSPMQAYDDASVMHWLSSDHAKLREQATLELMSRGYDAAELSIATQFFAGDVPTRIGLVDMIARDPSLDPRPWLWMMARDEHRDVRLRVVSVLATMNDPEAQNRLRTLMVDETDPIVAARIRRVLNLR